MRACAVSRVLQHMRLPCGQPTSVVCLAGRYLVELCLRAISSCIHRLPCCQSCRSVSPPIPLSSGSCLPQCSLVPAPPTVSGETRVPLGMWLSLPLNMPLLLLHRRGAYGAQCSVSAVRHSAACTCVIKGCVSIVFSLGGPVQ